MTDAAIGAPSRAVTSNIAPWLWFSFAIVALASIGVLAVAVAGWSAPTPIMAALTLVVALPLIVTVSNLVRTKAGSPPATLWLSLAVCIFLAGLTQVDAVQRVTPEDAKFVPIAILAFTPAFLALWFNVGWKRKDKRRWLTQAFNLLALSCVLIVGVIYAASHYLHLEVPVDNAVAVLFGLVITQPSLACLVQAMADKRLPVKPNGRPVLSHISGLGVFSLAMFVLVIVALGVWAATSRNGALISQDAGIAVFSGLGAAFVLVAVAPNLEGIDRFFARLHSLSPVKGIGGVASTLDGVLVFAVAGPMGTDQQNVLLRHLLLLGNLFAAALLGWWLPAPLGLLPLLWAFLAAVSVARRWSWIEEDRENAMLNRRFRGTHLKIGFSQDLRAEALLGFTSLLIVVPLALRQIHEGLGGHLFVVSPQDADNFIAWATFFGTELAKAVPFVDWAEIYPVHGVAPISVDNSKVGAAQHVIFATRILVDLVLLGALLQAISGSERNAKLKKMFYEDRSLNWLDPFQELKAFRQLATGERGKWKLVENVPGPFLAYDEDRLAALEERRDVVGFVARQLIQRRSPELLLVEESKIEKPDAYKLEEYLELARQREGAVSIVNLGAARYFLNVSGSLWQVRTEIVRMIGEHWQSPGAVSALCDIVMHPQTSDRRYEVRAEALKGLYQPAVAGDRNARRVICWAMKSDVALRNQRLAQSWIEKHTDWCN